MTAPRCEGCGRFSRGPMVYVGDEDGDGGWLGPCCQSAAERASEPGGAS